MLNKIRFIFIPTLLALLGVIIGYTFIHWLIFIHFKLFQLDQTILEFVIPFLICIYFAWFHLRPKLSLLKLENRTGSFKNFYSFILMFLFLIPLILSQTFISNITGEMTELESIEQINEFKTTKFYTIKKFYIDKPSVESYRKFETSGRHNQDLNMNLYMLMPIYVNKNDSTKKPIAWFGTTYHKKISNRMKEEKIDAEYHQFWMNSWKDFEQKNFSDFDYLERLESFKIRKSFTNALISYTDDYKANIPILLARYGAFEHRTDGNQKGLLLSIGIGSLVWLIMILIPGINANQLKRMKAGKPDMVFLEEMNEYREFLIPRAGYFVTPILIYLNLGIFLLLFLFTPFESQDLIKWGSLYTPKTMDGQWWRLLSSLFLHINSVHLVGNLISLFLVGIFLESAIGSKKFLLAYLISGILGGIVSLVWTSHLNSAGASDAIMGLYGLFLSLTATKVLKEQFLFYLSLIIIGINLFVGFISSNVNNAAHLGGLFGGFLFGLILNLLSNKKANN